MSFIAVPTAGASPYPAPMGSVSGLSSIPMPPPAPLGTSLRPAAFTSFARPAGASVRPVFGGTIGSIQAPIASVARPQVASPFLAGIQAASPLAAPAIAPAKIEAAKPAAPPPATTPDAAAPPPPKKAPKKPSKKKPCGCC
eukprot:gnl/TRDRNA2_/TRDRNA2_184024_c0_seq1.p1 gnl/TRDRNA2_/TRDRNA2_184024_c0~~gnl/TRDRNA2_/TRDRNA2_184024_c0_seq1.p1  ORF type:complete len:141 (-),score=17.47 gnl/TRDRNA2_/TRDRNA2_184024_c0_seq1:94-516(-)